MKQSTMKKIGDVLWVEINTKHQGFYGYKLKKTSQQINKKTINQKNTNTNKNNKLVSKLDDKFWNLIKDYFPNDDKMDIDETKEKEHQKAKKFIIKSQNHQKEIENEVIDNMNMETNNEESTTIKNKVNKNNGIVKMEIDTNNNNNKMNTRYNNDELT